MSSRPPKKKKRVLVSFPHSATPLDDIRHPFGESDFVQPIVSWRLTSRFDIVDAAAKAASKAIGGSAGFVTWMLVTWGYITHY